MSRRRVVSQVSTALVRPKSDEYQRQPRYWNFLTSVARRLLWLNRRLRCLIFLLHSSQHSRLLYFTLTMIEYGRRFPLACHGNVIHYLAFIVTEEAAAVCRQPMKRGYCRALHHKWAWSQAARACVSFVYGGCGGNENSFDSEETCLRVCSGATLLL